jgi:hypothetical protein
MKQIAINSQYSFNAFVRLQRSQALFVFMAQMDALLQFRMFPNFVPFRYHHLDEDSREK